MSRVFVSSACRDREVATRLSDILRGLGYEPVDDRDDKRGTAWWNEVVGRIETCELFVAVVTPAYAEAHTCRLAAKHASARGLAIVRLDVGDETVTDCHPAVLAAPPMRFDPADPGAEAVVARAFEAGTSPVPPDGPEPLVTAPPRARLEPVVAVPGQADPPPRMSGLELGLAAAMVALVGGLAWTFTPAVGAIVGASPELVAETQAPSDGGATTRPVPATPSPSPSASAQESEPPMGQELLTMIEAVGSDRLPASSCTAATEHVTCRDPAPGVETVEVAAFLTSDELYDAYTDELGDGSGDPVPENVGDCTGEEFEGERAWNLDLGHPTDITVEQQAAGGLDRVTEAAGRLFCTESDDVLTLVWTQDSALLVTATGEATAATIGWWRDVHLDLACAQDGHGAGCRGRQRT